MTSEKNNLKRMELLGEHFECCYSKNPYDNTWCFSTKETDHECGLGITLEKAVSNFIQSNKYKRDIKEILP